MSQDMSVSTEKLMMFSCNAVQILIFSWGMVVLLINWLVSTWRIFVDLAIWEIKSKSIKVCKAL